MDKTYLELCDHNIVIFTRHFVSLEIGEFAKNTKNDEGILAKTACSIFLFIKLSCDIELQILRH